MTESQLHQPKCPLIVKYSSLNATYNLKSIETKVYMANSKGIRFTLRLFFCINEGHTEGIRMLSLFNSLFLANKV